MAAVEIEHGQRRAIGPVDADHQDLGVQGAVRAAAISPDLRLRAADAEPRGRRVGVRLHSGQGRGFQERCHVIG